jgi:hypothetical protein
VALLLGRPKQVDELAADPRTVDITSMMPTGAEFHFMLVRQMVFHAARCVACHGVRSQPVPVALVGELPPSRSSRW